MLDVPFFALALWLDRAIDLTFPNLLVCLFGAAATVWTMQRITRDSGLSSSHCIGRLVFRILLGSLAIGMLAAGAIPVTESYEPKASSFLVNLFVAAVMAIVPLVTVVPPGDRGAVVLRRAVARRRTSASSSQRRSAKRKIKSLI